MSEAQHSSDSRDGPIGLSTKQIFLACAGATALAVVAAVLLGQGPSSSSRADAGEVEAIAARIQPVGKVTIKLEGGPAKTGEVVYKAQCAACHDAGLVGAPKFGDAAAWSARLGAGFEGLLNSALKGKGNMGAQGGGDFSDYEIGRAVVFVANAGGAKFEEPKPPQAAASQ